ncbi:MAG: flagellar protein FlaG [Pseudomonadales bacterium]|nr:flagellar protein FlaG [Pseudomonadales bacterium]
MNINNPPSGVSVNAPNKVTARTAEVKVKKPEAEINSASNVQADDKVQKAESKERVQAAKDLKSEQLEQKVQQETQEKVETAVETIRGFIQENQRDLDFDVAKESNRVIITVKDKVTNEVIRQIPPEDAIELAERIKSGDDITKGSILLGSNLQA